MKKTLAALVSGGLTSLVLASACQAEAIYKWVDESGRTHVSDLVPDKYRGVAERIDSSRFELSAKDKAAAEARAAALRSRASRSAEQASSAGPAAPSRVASSAGSIANRDAVVSEECKTWRKKFSLSRDCFAGFTLPDGSLRPGAFQQCGDDVQNPEPTCGPENWR